MTYISAIAPITVDVLYSGLPRIPNLGEEVFAKTFDVQIGGGPTAMLITLRKLGIEGKLGTFLATDSMSDIARNLLVKYDVDYVNLYGGDSTPVVVTSIASFPEDRYFLTYNPEINEKSCTDDEVYELLKGSRVCFGVQGHDQVLRRLNKEGTIIVYDVGWQDDLHVDQLKDILQWVSVFTPNEKEALKMTNTTTARDALEVLDKYVECVIITLGAEGCITKTKDGVLHIPSVKNFTAIDTTGAGDNFLAGVMYGLYNTMSIKDCMKIGNIVGGYSTTQLGCCKAEINLEIVNHYLKKAYGDI